MPDRHVVRVLPPRFGKPDLFRTAALAWNVLTDAGVHLGIAAQIRDVAIGAIRKRLLRGATGAQEAVPLAVRYALSAIIMELHPMYALFDQVVDGWSGQVLHEDNWQVRVASASSCCVEGAKRVSEIAAELCCLTDDATEIQRLVRWSQRSGLFRPRSSWVQEIIAHSALGTLAD